MVIDVILIFQNGKHLRKWDMTMMLPDSLVHVYTKTWTHDTGILDIDPTITHHISKPVTLPGPKGGLVRWEIKPTH
jgi:hypothetical protein